MTTKPLHTVPSYVDAPSIVHAVCHEGIVTAILNPSRHLVFIRLGNTREVIQRNGIEAIWDHEDGFMELRNLIYRG